MKHGFGIIGAGSIAEVHARAIDTLMDAELVGIFDHNPGKTQSFSTKYNCRAFESIEELCNDDGIDMVCICTPSGKHLEPALSAITSGKHCIVEKPLETSIERCDRIINAGIKHNVLVSGIFPMRFSRVNMELKKAIDQGRFGKMVMGDAYVKWFRTPEYYKEVKWRSDLAASGGGAVMNQAIHSVDLLRWFMGKVSAVCAFSGLVGHEGIEVEDVASATLKFENGAVGVIEASTAVNPGFYRRIEVLGTKGSVVIEEEKLLTWKFDEETGDDERIREKYSGSNLTGGGVSDPKAISDLGHLRQLLDIIKAVDNGRAPAVDAPEAKKAVELVLAIYASAKNKRIVYL